MALKYVVVEVQEEYNCTEELLSFDNPEIAMDAARQYYIKYQYRKPESTFRVEVRDA